MSITATGSVINTDMINMLRGLYRDNSTHTLTGSVAETTLASTTITGGTMTATGCIYIFAAGNTSGGASTKTVKLILGTTNILSIAGLASGTNVWELRARISNTASNAQRVSAFLTYGGSNAAVTVYGNGYGTGTEDTATNLTLKTTGTLANAGDTMANTVFEVFVAQIQ